MLAHLLILKLLRTCTVLLLLSRHDLLVQNLHGLLLLHVLIEFDEFFPHLRNHLNLAQENLVQPHSVVEHIRVLSIDHIKQLHVLLHNADRSIDVFLV